MMTPRRTADGDANGRDNDPPTGRGTELTKESRCTSAWSEKRQIITRKIRLKRTGEQEHDTATAMLSARTSAAQCRRGHYCQPHASASPGGVTFTADPDAMFSQVHVDPSATLMCTFSKVMFWHGWFAYPFKDPR